MSPTRDELAPPVTRVPVPGGELTVGVWGGEDTSAPTVVALHGITASHRCWPLVAAALPGVRMVAPDLRGRGRSADLPPPYGLAQHAADVDAVMAALVDAPALVVGHSMGGFVAVQVAALAPERVRSLLLVDGGLPLPVPGGGPPPSPEQALGPAGERLRMTFADRLDYRDFWRDHPAFASAWGPVVEGYVDYDLGGSEPELRPVAHPEAVGVDGSQLFGDPAHLDALDAVARSGLPIRLLRAPRGLMDEPTPLYAPETVAAGVRRVPQLVVEDVDDVNHYTIVMAPAGAQAVAAALRQELATT